MKRGKINIVLFLSSFAAYFINVRVASGDMAVFTTTSTLQEVVSDWTVLWVVVVVSVKVACRLWRIDTRCSFFIVPWSWGPVDSSEMLVHLYQITLFHISETQSLGHFCVFVTCNFFFIRVRSIGSRCTAAYKAYCAIRATYSPQRKHFLFFLRFWKWLRFILHFTASYNTGWFNLNSSLGRRGGDCESGCRLWRMGTRC